MSVEPSQTATAEIRRLAAIMFTDIVGFSRQMGSNETRTLRLLDVHNQTIRQAVAEHHGVVIKTIGDAFLVDFPSVVHAVQCAQRIQAQFKSHNAEKDKAEQIHVRIGIHLGDIVQRDGDVFGDGVNIASRLQGLAEPDTVCISDMVYRDVAKKLSLGPVISLGRPKLKNIAQRFPIYALLAEPPHGLWQALQVQRLKLSRRVGTTVSVLVLVSVLLLGGIVILLYPSLPTFIIQHSSFSVQEAQPPLLPLPDKPSIVVLPFVNMSGDPEQEYFSDGLTEDLTSDLTRISSLFVIARNSAFTYKGKAVKVQDVGREMGVRYVLEGSVRKADGQVRITAQLIDATTGYHVWSGQYDRPLKDIFALQDEIVQKIVTTLRLQLTLQEQGYIVRKSTDNVEAYDSFLRGVEYFTRTTKEANAQARQLFERAIALDPQYANAYTMLGWTYSQEWIWRWSTAPQTLERALALAHQALAIDDSLPMSYSLLSVSYRHKQQHDRAIAAGERAIALDPNNATSYAFQSEVLNSAGRSEEALKMAEQAIRLNPRFPPHYLFMLGWAYYSTGRHAEAVTTLKEVLNRNPNYLAASLFLVATYIDQWLTQQNPDALVLESALAAVQDALARDDTNPLNHRILGVVYLCQKQYEQAIVEVERAIALDSEEAEGYALLAQMLSRLGKAEEAVAMLEQALRRKPTMVDGNLLHMGVTYYLTGRLEEAIPPLKQLLARYPNKLGFHLLLAAVYNELGKESEARAEAAEVLRLNPNFSLEVHRQREPIRDPAVLERHLAALRKAGLE
jgi:adenylate cyclase